MDLAGILKREEYKFLQAEEHLGKHIILLGLAGSHAYGTNGEGSDLDIRGVALNRKSDLIGLTDYEQYTDSQTDTVVFTFRKMVRLLLSCNPNTVELLGLRPEHYLFLNGIGKSLIGNTSLFLSKRAIQSFGGYADAQLRRLQNALARDSYPQSEKERHIYRSIQNAMHSILARYGKFEEGAIHLYIDRSAHPDFDTEIFMDVSLSHYPLRDYKNIWNEMNHIVKDYDKVGKRNRKKDGNHLNKHAMHLVRLLMMAIDILEKEKVCTYRKAEHSLLLQIRRGAYQREDGTFREEFYEIVNDYEKKLEYAAKHTELPEEPDLGKVQEYVMAVNEKVVRDEI